MNGQEQSNGKKILDEVREVMRLDWWGGYNGRPMYWDVGRVTSRGAGCHSAGSGDPAYSRF